METLVEDFREKGICDKDLEVLVALSQGDKKAFKRYAQRRLFHEPLAYICGKVVFYGRSFKVDRRTYIPNPETEQLVSVVLDELENDSVVLDVGTGSGCLGITIAKERPQIKVLGCDIDPHALAVAEENTKYHNVAIPFYESYYVDSVPVMPTHIVADMPYGNKDYTLASINLTEFRHMPPLACFHPLGIMEAYTELIHSIQRKKWHCRLFFESGVLSKNDVEKGIPNSLSMEYIPFNGYSVTIVDI